MLLSERGNRKLYGFPASCDRALIGAVTPMLASSDENTCVFCLIPDTSVSIQELKQSSSLKRRLKPNKEKLILFLPHQEKRIVAIFVGKVSRRDLRTRNKVIESKRSDRWLDLLSPQQEVLIIQLFCDLMGKICCREQQRRNILLHWNCVNQSLTRVVCRHRVTGVAPDSTEAMKKDQKALDIKCYETKLNNLKHREILLFNRLSSNYIKSKLIE